MTAKALGLMGSDRNFEQAKGFLAKPQVQGSDPNSGHGLRAGQQSLTDLGSDPNNSDPNNPGSNLNCPHTRMASTLASNWVAVVDRDVFVFIFGPTLTPRPLPPRRAGKGANSHI